MKKLRIDMEELDSVWEVDREAYTAYLDTETGAIVTVHPEARGYLEDFYESHEGEEGADETQALTAWVEASDCPEWMREDVLRAQQVESAPPDRYLETPEQDSFRGYRVMEDFIATVADPHLRAQLRRAISGRKPFRSFKDALNEFPEEQQRWYQFHDRRRKERMREWLAEHDIEPVE